jgi:hypothetical protein
MEHAGTDVDVAKLEISALESKKDLMTAQLELKKAQLVEKHGGEIDVKTYEGAVADAQRDYDDRERAVMEAKQKAAQ